MSIISTIHAGVTASDSIDNPWEAVNADRAALVLHVIDVALNGPTRLLPNLIKFCNKFYDLAWYGKDPDGNLPGLSPREFFATLGPDGATVVNAYGLSAQTCHLLAPGSVNMTPPEEIHRLESGWIWVGSLEDKPDDYGALTAAEDTDDPMPYEEQPPDTEEAQP